MILLINTCGVDAVVALAGPDGVLAEENLPGRSASEQLVPALRLLLAGADVLEAVAVVHGPGSFTGVRVGLAAAKGLCEARACGMIAMSRLALVAGDEDAVALLDAGRGEFFCRLPASGRNPAAESLLRRSEWLPFLQGRRLLTCEPQVVAGLQTGTAPPALIHLLPEPGAESMLAMARRRIAAGQWSDVATIDANYLRRTDAELLQERL